MGELVTLTAFTPPLLERKRSRILSAAEILTNPKRVRLTAACSVDTQLLMPENVRKLIHTAVHANSTPISSHDVDFDSSPEFGTRSRRDSRDHDEESAAPTDVSEQSDKTEHVVRVVPQSVPFIQVPTDLAPWRWSDSGVIPGDHVVLPKAKTCLPLGRSLSSQRFDNSSFKDDKELYKREIESRSNNAGRHRSMFHALNEKYLAFAQRLRSSVGEQLRFRSLSYSKLIRSRPPYIFVHLTDDDLTLVDDVLATAALEPHTVVATIEGAEITKKDMACLLPGEWLNDEVMNAYMNLLNARTRYIFDVTIPKPRPFDYCVKTYYWSTFFYSSLTGETSLGHREYCYDRVRRWTRRKKIDIFSYDLLCIPLHIQKIHWALGAVDLQSKLVFFFDSLGSDPDPTFYPTVLQYLDDEHMDKKGTPLPDKEAWLFGGNNYAHSRLVPARLFTQFKIFSSAETTTTQVHIPQQSNGSDCGVFTCQYAEALGCGRFPFAFEAKEIPLRRKRMALEIIKQKIMFY